MNRKVGKRNLYQIYRQLWNLLSFRRKRQVIFAFILIISSAIAEMLNILSIYPLLRIITSQKDIFQDRLLNFFTFLSSYSSDNLILGVCNETIK